ncbi:MAG: Rrf2 family transcriptional regulator [Planctomycetaceae bacterium]|nr:Rrf2 family transcriptional regulator [Planctomycetaceae bacterium]
MNVSAKTEYACIAVLELALNYGSGEPVTIRAIAETHGIPSRFLVQILLQLKGAGLVGSTRGAAGGYQLIQDPQQLTLAEVMRVIEGNLRQLTNNAERTTPVSGALFDAWQEVANAEQQMLQTLSFADLVERVRGQTEKMYYI